MTGRTNYTPADNASDFGFDQINAGLDHFDKLVGEFVTTATSLPSTGNWVGRTITAGDTGTLYLCTSLPSTWQYVHRDTGWVAPPAFNSGWTDHDPVTDPVRIRLRGGFLILSGRVAKATSGADTVFTLPVGYRPSRVALCATPHDGGLAKVWVGTDGKVQVLGADVGTAFSSLSLTVPPLPLF